MEQAQGKSQQTIVNKYMQQLQKPEKYEKGNFVIAVINAEKPNKWTIAQIVDENVEDAKTIYPELGMPGVFQVQLH